MKHGKETCKILKGIRRDIASQNDIPLEERECTYEGECRGTCPYCEAEVRYLEKELQKRSLMGKAVTIAGLAIGSMALTACEPQTAGDAMEPITTHKTEEVADTGADTIPVTPSDSATADKEEEKPIEYILGESYWLMVEGEVTEDDMVDPDPAPSGDSFSQDSL